MTTTKYQNNVIIIEYRIKLSNNFQTISENLPEIGVGKIQEIELCVQDNR